MRRILHIYHYKCNNYIILFHFLDPYRIDTCIYHDQQNKMRRCSHCSLVLLPRSGERLHELIQMLVIPLKASSLKCCTYCMHMIYKSISTYNFEVYFLWRWKGTDLLILKMTDVIKIKL